MLSSALSSLLLVIAPLTGSHQRMYVNNGYLHFAIDPTDGTVVNRAFMSPWKLNGGFAYCEGKLYYIDQNIGLKRDALIEMDIATARTRVVGLTGVSVGYHIGLACNPVDNELYATFGNDFYHINKVNGQATFIGSADPTFEQLGITAMTFDASGRCIVASTQVLVHRSAFYELSLFDASTKELGVPAIENGFFSTLAFDADGRLWGSHKPFVGPPKGNTYIIDLATFVPTKMFDIPFGGGWAFCFGPAPRVDGYCVATSSGAGCVPQADWHGHPSASSDGGFSITCCEAQNQSAGMLLIGTGGRASTPFQGGTLCVSPPWSAAAAGSSGGSPASTADCSGAWSLDLNAWLSQHAPQSPSTLVQVQWWGRDSTGVAMSSAALEVALLP